MTLRKGTTSNDTLIAGVGAESFDGLSGDDLVSYGASIRHAGIDLLDASLNTGEAAKDTFASIEAYTLSIYADWFAGSNSAESVAGGNGGDRLSGRGGDDKLYGQAGNDTLSGGVGNDRAWGGAGSDSISGGAGNDVLTGEDGQDRFDGGSDTGKIVLNTKVFEHVMARGGLDVSLSQVDSKGDVALLSHAWSGHAASLYGIAVSFLGVIDGDMLYAVSNRVPMNTAFALLKNPNDWTVSTPMYVLPEGATAIVNMGAPTGPIPSGFTPPVFIKTTSPGWPLNKQSPIKAVLVTDTTTTVTSLKVGDTLNGGSGDDTFVFTPGPSGVDRINGFVKGQDHLDLASKWFDGDAANGEFKALSHAGGSLIVFADNSADGYVDNTGIFLSGVHAASVDRSFFI